MDDDLERFFGELAAAVPTTITQPTDYLEFSAETLPLPPQELTTGRIYVEKMTHGYDEFYEVNGVIFRAHKATYRQLALLILAVVFHPEREVVRLRLTHRASAFRMLLISCSGQARSRWTSLTSRAVSSIYSPEEIQRFPWYDLPAPAEELPCFYLRTDPIYSSRAGPDVVAGFGGDRGCVRLAELLLNLGRPETALTEVGLESEAGYRGVGPVSAEARFVLPGAIAWYPEEWPA